MHARDESRRRLWLGVGLFAVVGLQVLANWGRLGAPFLDTRLHYSYDNADSGFRIRNGIRNGDLRSQFGVTVNTYARWGEIAGPPSYYTDHPFLVKALLQLYARVTGPSEWAIRSFYLLVAIATAAGFYWILAQTTRGVFPSVAGTAAMIALPLFAVYQVSVKVETEGMLLAVWIYAVFVACLERGSRGTRVAYGVLVTAAFLVHWTAILFVACLGVHQLLLSRRNARVRDLLRTTGTASVIGLVALIVMASYLQHGWAGAAASLTQKFAVRTQPIPLGDWIARQLIYLRKNFTMVGVLATVAMLPLFGTRLWKLNRSDEGADPATSVNKINLLAGFIASTSAVAVIWIVLFRQGSFIHVYWQYWLCLPIGALVGGTVSLAEEASSSPALWRLAACALVAWLLLSAQNAYAGITRDQLGTREDIEFLKSLRQDRFARFAFVPVTDTPLTQWFQGPLFLYYTDRPVTVANRPQDVRRGDKLLILRYADRPAVMRQLQSWSGMHPTNEKCGLRICAYDLE